MESSSQITYGFGGSDRPPIEPGREATIKNLKSRADLNGTVGTIKELLSKEGRVAVEIPPLLFAGLNAKKKKWTKKEVIAVLPEKLEVLWNNTGANSTSSTGTAWGQGDTCPICYDTVMSTVLDTNRTATVMTCCGGKICGHCFVKIVTGDDPDRCALCRTDTTDCSDAAELAKVMARANAGNANACYNLGGYYDYGKMGLRQDQAAARKWYERGALAGECRAANNLACSYRDGEGGPRDLKEAARFFRMAAEGGHVAAGTNLGMAYMMGHGVPQDFTEAEKWLTAGANAGDQLAMQQLQMVKMANRRK